MKSSKGRNSVIVGMIFLTVEKYHYFVVYLWSNNPKHIPMQPTIQHYLQEAGGCNIYSLNEDFLIIKNPTFTIVPNYLYRLEHIVVMYCCRGSAKGRVNTSIYDLSEGGFFIVLPGQITELIEQDDDFEAIYIIMSPEFTSHLSIGNTFDLRNIIAHKPYTVLSQPARQALESYITMCCTQIEMENHPHRSEIIYLLTRAFFLGLGYFLHQHDDLAQDDRATRICQDFIHRVEHNYAEHRDLGFYAEQLGLTAKHISTVVKMASGKSATDWIERYVTLDAISQLISTPNTIKEIAYNLNFPSQSCFGKYFSRVVGCSPQSYRQKHRQ